MDCFGSRATRRSMCTGLTMTRCVPLVSLLGCRRQGEQTAGFRACGGSAKRAEAGAHCCQTASRRANGCFLWKPPSKTRSANDTFWSTAAGWSWDKAVVLDFAVERQSATIPAILQQESRQAPSRYFSSLTLKGRFPRPDTQALCGRILLGRRNVVLLAARTLSDLADLPCARGTNWSSVRTLCSHFQPKQFGVTQPIFPNLMFAARI